ncbi:S8 family serine peptidase [Wenjunlia tyrosinilytica]|uniref:S8 family serine peptidase n=1 Tax=Wenjunlia tyrosinilytica TaxID=1544741 RepID=UPI001E3B0763|nr:S8 family serine peptidase [Wenjunlia tyrosinilytica]
MADPIARRYIVVFKDKAMSPRSVKGESARIVRAHGGEVWHTYGSVLKGYAARMTAAQARRAAADPRVSYVEQDAVAHGSATQSNPPSWGLDRVDQRDLPLDKSYTYAGTASNVTAYVVDSGIRTSHSQFQERASVGVDEVGDGKNGQDCFGHGTHVAGTIGGKDHGVAKGVKLVSVRVLNCDDSASTSGIIAAADWITAHAVKPAVVNMSINGSANSSEDTAIKNSIASGITWVVSSGNSNANACNNSPGSIGPAIVVNNADSADRRRSDSNYGPCTDLFAPGTGIVSSWYTSDTATQTKTGTSQAAPHVTGAAALYLSKHPTASPADVQSALVGNATADKITGAGSGSPNRLLYTGGLGGSTGGGSVVFSDDFESHKGWTVNASGTDTATAGVWDRGNPDRTTSASSGQIKQLGTTVSGVGALSTGSAAGASDGANDLDGGVTSIRSGAITLPAGGALTLDLSYNVANGKNSGIDDYLRVKVVDGSTATTVFTRTGSAAEVPGAWQTAAADLSAFAGKSIRLSVEAADAGAASLFEAQVDDVSITSG